MLKMTVYSFEATKEESSRKVNEVANKFMVLIWAGVVADVVKK